MLLDVIYSKVGDNYKVHIGNDKRTIDGDTFTALLRKYGRSAGGDVSIAGSLSVEEADVAALLSAG